MAYELERLAGNKTAISAEALRKAIDKLERLDRPRFRRLWAYYRNPMQPFSAIGEQTSPRPYLQAQEWGLPSRITGLRSGGEMFSGQCAAGIARKEVVIENDIGWRVETMVDYLFGKPLVIHSTAAHPARRELIGRLVRALLAHNGGILFLQELALLGSVHGFVDVLVKVVSPPPPPAPAASAPAHTSGGATGMQQLGEPPAEGGAGGSAIEGGGIEAGAAPQTQPPGTSGLGTTGGSTPASTDEPAGTGASITSHEALIERIARMIRLEIVEPARALPLLSPLDYRVVEAYAQHYSLQASRPATRSRRPWMDRLLRSADRFLRPQREEDLSQRIAITEIVTPLRWQRYEDEALVAEGENPLGRIPLVHIQNTATPFEYSGTSDVEGLIPLQDELNTRLSDRANRVALQSFKMYLGKGIENFLDLPVSPGRMWTTDNEKAEVIEFGGDESCPSEALHIADVREALDKSSGVSPIAAGAIKNRIGRLTSAAALRVTLISLLAKTDKKRTTYGTGLNQMVELALAWLDATGIFHTDPQERGIEVHWPSPLPENQLETLQEAEVKTRLGVPKEVVLKELGY